MPDQITRKTTNTASVDKALFNRIAEQYGRKDLLPAHRLARKLRLEQSMAALGDKSGLDILEVGCGAGFSADYLAGRYNTYLGLDYSEALIALARQANSRDGATFTVADISTFETNQRYDAIIMIGLLHHLENPSGALAHMAKFVKPGGYVIANEPQSGNPFISFLRAIRKKTDAAYSEDQIEYSRAELRAQAERAGLSDITVTAQGYFSPPFAEVAMPLQPVVTILSRLACWLDRQLERTGWRRLQPLAWNAILTAKAPEQNGK